MGAGAGDGTRAGAGEGGAARTTPAELAAMPASTARKRTCLRRFKTVTS